MTARELLERLQQYAQDHPDAIDQPIELTIYRGGNSHYNLTCVITGSGWSSLQPNSLEHITLSIRAKDLERT